MNNIEKYGTMLVAVTGGWAVYNDFSDSEFKKQITLREAKVKSYKSQIASAKGRDDKDEVLRVTLDYEKYEESWRNRQTLSSITEPINNLVNVKVSQNEIIKLEELLKDQEFYFSVGKLEPETVGSAYLATGNFVKVDQYYQAAADLDPTNANVYALRSLALQGEALTESAEAVRKELIRKAMELARTAEAKGVDPKKIEALTSELKASK
jgi:tetratricopeptide (TPR) repeat protein